MSQHFYARGLAPRRQSRVLTPLAAPALLALATFASVAHAQAAGPGDLVVSRSVYVNGDTITTGAILPPGCTGTTGGCAGGTGAIANSQYPYVFNNDSYDSSFGITSPIFLDEIDLHGNLLGTLEVPNSTVPGITSTSDQLVTSFSSKSELGLHLSTDKQHITFMGYVAPVNKIDISNSNTPGVVDPTNPVGENAYRAVATVDASGNFTFTETNAYSGNNGRQAILNSTGNVFYTAGNAGNGANPQPTGVVLGAGTQIIERATVGENQQNPGTPTPVGSFSITEIPANTKPDKVGKDDNFRGIALYKNVLYYTKGSGSNGIDTVYFLDTTGTACPQGVGLPSPTATLPTTALTPSGSTLPNNMCVLKGFPTGLAKTNPAGLYPFGLWFANDTTLYVADEGDGTNGSDQYTHAAAQTTAGLQKWIFNTTTQTWNLAYTLQTGLNLGKPYVVSGYPTGVNSVTGLPWTPATDGLRNITGLVGDGTIPEVPVGKVAIYGITSTISGAGDQGADPNRLVVIVDDLANTNPAVAKKETFYTVRAAKSGEVLRGVSFTPGTANVTSF
jgi:hypothetical protein